MKFNGTVYKTVKSPGNFPGLGEGPFGQDKIGTFSVPASKKWSSVFNLFQVRFFPHLNIKGTILS